MVHIRYNWNRIICTNKLPVVTLLLTTTTHDRPSGFLPPAFLPSGPSSGLLVSDLREVPPYPSFSLASPVCAEGVP